MGAVVHSFAERLRYSESASRETFWQDVYRSAFPDMVLAVQSTGDTPSQRRGIDRVIHLASGKTLYVDEKVRERDYGDVLLEYESVSTTGAPGWIEKDDLLIDYLAYAFMPTRRVLLFDWPMLRAAWIKFGERWKEHGENRELGYRTVVAENRDYYTTSVAVPEDHLRLAIRHIREIRLSQAA